MCRCGWREVVLCLSEEVNGQADGDQSPQQGAHQERVEVVAADALQVGKEEEVGVELLPVDAVVTSTMHAQVRDQAGCVEAAMWEAGNLVDGCKFRNEGSSVNDNFLRSLLVRALTMHKNTAF